MPTRPRVKIGNVEGRFIIAAQYRQHGAFWDIIIYKEMFLGCDWLIRVQLIPNITQNSAKICNTVQKSVTTVQKSVTTVQKSVTTVQKSVISSLSDGISSLKNQKYGGRIFTFA